tara:strand:- start:164 stop:310 length:147 start_codon:yes stop_codon:yes gene_type:complete
MKLRSNEYEITKELANKLFKGRVVLVKKGATKSEKETIEPEHFDCWWR